MPVACNEILTVFVSGVDLRLENAETRHDDGRQGARPQKGGRLPTHRLHLGHHPCTAAAAKQHKVRLWIISNVTLGFTAPLSKVNSGHLLLIQKLWRLVEKRHKYRFLRPELQSVAVEGFVF